MLVFRCLPTFKQSLISTEVVEVTSCKALVFRDAAKVCKAGSFSTCRPPLEHRRSFDLRPAASLTVLRCFGSRSIIAASRQATQVNTYGGPMEPRQVGPHGFLQHSASRPHMQVIPSTLLGNASGNLVKMQTIFRTQKNKHGPTASFPPKRPGFSTQEPP